jgi:hypothetical protein
MKTWMAGPVDAAAHSGDAIRHRSSGPGSPVADVLRESRVCRGVRVRDNRARWRSGSSTEPRHNQPSGLLGLGRRKERGWTTSQTKAMRGKHEALGDPARVELRVLTPRCVVHREQNDHGSGGKVSRVAPQQAHLLPEVTVPDDNESPWLTVARRPRPASRFQRSHDLVRRHRRVGEPPCGPQRRRLCPQRLTRVPQARLSDPSRSCSPSPRTARSSTRKGRVWSCPATSRAAAMSVASSACTSATPTPSTPPDQPLADAAARPRRGGQVATPHRRDRASGVHRHELDQSVPWRRRSVGSPARNAVRARFSVGRNGGRAAAIHGSCA